MTDLVLVNARITTLDREKREAESVAIRDGRFLATGSEREVRAAARPDARVIDAGGRRAVPGLIDSHTHLIRGGLSYTMELRWDGLTSLVEAMRRLKAQAERTPHRNGCRSSAGSPGPSSPRSACRRSRK